jgi:hypothetical protein
MGSFEDYSGEGRAESHNSSAGGGSRHPGRLDGVLGDQMDSWLPRRSFGVLVGGFQTPKEDLP